MNRLSVIRWKAQAFRNFFSFVELTPGQLARLPGDLKALNADCDATLAAHNRMEDARRRGVYRGPETEEERELEECGKALAIVLAKRSTA